MKIFAFIMAFLVLALSVLPCMDDSDALNGQANTAIAAAENNSRHNEKDECSPFCTCSCCSVSTINQTSILTSFHKPAFQQKNYSLHKPSFYSNIASAIWQPPKLS